MANIANIISDLDSIFTCNENGLYENFDIDEFANHMGLTVDEAEDMLIDAENEGYVSDEMDGLYNAAKLAEWEEYNEAEEEAEARAEAAYRAEVEWNWNHR